MVASWPFAWQTGTLARAPSHAGCSEALPDGHAGLLGTCWGSTWQEDLGRAEDVGQGNGSWLRWGACSAPWTASSRLCSSVPPPDLVGWVRPPSAQWVGGAVRSAVRARWPLPRQPVGGGRRRADGRAEDAQPVCCSNGHAVRRRAQRLPGPKRAAGSRHPQPPRLSHEWGLELEPVKMKMSSEGFRVAGSSLDLSFPIRN